MDYRDRISSNFSIMLGKPCIKGTRITVELILEKLSQGATIDSLLEAYPHISKEDIYAVLSYAADIMATEAVIELA